MFAHRSDGFFLVFTGDEGASVKMVTTNKGEKTNVSFQTICDAEKAQDRAYSHHAIGAKVLLCGQMPNDTDTNGSSEKLANDHDSDGIEDLRGQLDEIREQMALLQENADKMEQDDEVGEPLLPEDSYSFLATARSDHETWYRQGRSFYAALGIFLFQILTFALLAFDIVDIENDNPLDIPAGVDIQVRISQLIALIITAISQDEVRQSLNVLYNGYDQDALSRGFGGASRFKWH